MNYNKLKNFKKDKNDTFEDLKPERLNSDLLNSIYINENSKLFYVDHFLCSDFYLNVNIFESSINNSYINLRYKSNLNIYRKCLRNKDYEGVFTLLDKQKRMPWLIKNFRKLFNHYGEKLFYRIFRENLIYVDHHYPYRRAYKKILNCGTKTHLMMNAKEKKELSKLNKVVTIYRGVCIEAGHKSISKSNKDKLIGHSWTTHYKKAEWFACCHAPKFTQEPLTNAVLSYEIKKQDIIAYFLDRNEFEIFIDPKTIDAKSIQIQLLTKKRAKNIISKLK